MKKANTPQVSDKLNKAEPTISERHLCSLQIMKEDVEAIRWALNELNFRFFGSRTSYSCLPDDDGDPDAPEGLWPLIEDECQQIVSTTYRIRDELDRLKTAI